ncbi:hypothetical protein KCU71_g7, partial [Aureobasidium melanogenum]
LSRARCSQDLQTRSLESYFAKSGRATGICIDSGQKRKDSKISLVVHDCLWSGSKDAAPARPFTRLDRSCQTIQYWMTFEPIDTTVASMCRRSHDGAKILAKRLGGLAESAALMHQLRTVARRLLEACPSPNDPYVDLFLDLSISITHLTFAPDVTEMFAMMPQDVDADWEIHFCSKQDSETTPTEKENTRPHSASSSIEVTHNDKTWTHRHNRLGESEDMSRSLGEIDFDSFDNVKDDLAALLAGKRLIGCE